MSSLRKFASHYSQFIGVSVISQLLGFITFPILTRLLTKEQYGMLGLVTTTMLLSVAIAKAGLSDGIIRLYKEYDETQEQRDLFSSTIIIRGIILAFISVVVYLLIMPYVNDYLHIDKIYNSCFMLMAIYLFIRPLNIIILNVLRIRGKIWFVNITGLIGRVLTIVISLSLLIYIIRELYGYFVGIIVGELLGTIILFTWFLKNYNIRFKNVSGELTVRLIKFGAPLLLTELSWLLLTYLGRYMVLSYRGEGTLGLYSVGYNLAMYISDIITFSLSYAIVPVYVTLYSSEGKVKTEEFLKRAFHYVIIALIPICMGYYAISEDLFVTLASRKYLAAAAFSPIILVASLFLGVNCLLNAGLYLMKKTMVLLGIMVTALVVNVVSNMLLIPQYGAMGAAVATLFSCMTATGLTVLLSFKYITISIDVKTVIYYLALSTLMLLVIRQIDTSLVWLNLIAKIGVGIAIFTPGLLFKEKEILSKVKSILTRSTHLN
jgi:O-antigen/teichoic acid export membrane protein